MCVLSLTDDDGEYVCELIRSEPVHCPGKTKIFGLYEWSFITSTSVIAQCDGVSYEDRSHTSSLTARLNLV